ncbi:MAG: MFS transporter [Desulfobacteraceae bacterium]|nr:MFS transporter [Desulfobacteraceae bacterium]
MNNKGIKQKAYNKWIVFLLVATAIFMSTLDSSIVNVALPYIMEDLHTRVNIIQWVVLAYLVSVSSLLLTFGRLSDTRGRRIIYTYGFLVFSVGSFFCSIAQTPFFLIVSRGIQGGGAAMLMACSPAIIIDLFPPKERGKAIGMMGTVVAAGLTAGPVAGGILLDLFSWRSIFYINIPIGLIALFAGFYILKDTNADKGNFEPLDRKGSITLVISICFFIIALTHLDRWDILSFKLLSFFIISFLAFFIFIKTEAKTQYPLFDPKLLKIKLFLFPIISAAILFSALFTIIFLMPFYLTYPCNYSASTTGFIMITPFIFLFFFSPVSGAMYDKIGSRWLCTIGISLLTLSLASFAFINNSSDLISILWRLALAGTGTALFISPNNTAAMNSSPLSKRGIASGSVATSRNIGMVIGVSVAGLIFSSTYSNLTGGASFENYTQEMNVFFMTAFRKAMIAGAIIAAPGIFFSYMRGNDRP